MKKMNNKGFTLIELLAVIVILAILMVVTLPNVLGSMDKAKEGQLNNAANSIAKWLKDEYELAAINESFGSSTGSVNAAYTTLIASADDSSTPDVEFPESETQYAEVLPRDMVDSDAAVKNPNLLIAAGINGATKVKVKAYYNNGTEQWCVKIKAEAGSNFYAKSNGANLAVTSSCTNKGEY